MPPKDISHIDGAQFSPWLVELLGLKGEKSQPNEIDLGPASTVIELTQAGFAGGYIRVPYSVEGTAINGVAAHNRDYNPDMRLSNTGTEGGARVHQLCDRLIMNQAGALAVCPVASTRWIVWNAHLINSSGTVHCVAVETNQVTSYRGTYSFNPLLYWDGFIPEDYILRIALSLQPDWTAGGGVANFPAGTTRSSYAISTAKNKGAQLPI